MCRATIDGGRRCPGCVGEQRRIKDRARALAKTASQTQVPRQHPENQRPSQPANWQDTLTTIRNNAARIQTLLNERQYSAAEQVVCETGALVANEMDRREHVTSGERSQLVAQMVDVFVAVNKLEAIEPRNAEQNKELHLLRKKALSQGQDFNNHRDAAHAQAVMDVLSEIRELGGVVEFHRGSAPKTSKTFNEYIQCFPNEWIARSNVEKLHVRKHAGRARYSSRKRISWIEPGAPYREHTWVLNGNIEDIQRDLDESPGVIPWDYDRAKYRSYRIEQTPREVRVVFTTHSKQSTQDVAPSIMFSSRRDAIHEMGHRCEKVVPGLVNLERAFLARRTNDDAPPRELIGEKDDKYAYEGGFVDPYIGRIYEGVLENEVFSCGSEAVLDGTFGWLQGDERYRADPDHRAFTLGCLATL